ncbi:MAG TPA: 16S rRNA (cytosine(967)-C(5))-methyltransferase RsmB, partial [Rhodanobacteraceae bacterium]|nr:16S rRNA (cytosine(967)-C(5))-methyltransferase RsmB [Rhodanobacteraceae bacterium]
DRDESRIARIGENLVRLGLAADVRPGDAQDPSAWWDGRPFDRILLDAPCSATGIIRRQPDIKLHRRASDIAALTSAQQGFVRALWPLLAPGGRLVYATCSVLRAENEAVVGAFLDACPAARGMTVPAAFGVESGAGRQHLPGAAGMDGFYYAIVEKAR